MRKIKIGHYLRDGKTGDIYEDYDKAKACNFCIHFKGYGLHGFAGRCFKFNKDITGGYVGNYSKVAQKCDSFECKPELLKED